MNEKERAALLDRLIIGLVFTDNPPAEPDCECGGYWIVERNWYTGEVNEVYCDKCGRNQDD
jgi:hypothetical protein